MRHEKHDKPPGRVFPAYIVQTDPDLFRMVGIVIYVQHAVFICNGIAPCSKSRKGRKQWSQLIHLSSDRLLISGTAPFDQKRERGSEYQGAKVVIDYAEILLSRPEADAAAADRVRVIIYTAKPGVVIGRGGSEIDKLKAEVQKYTKNKLFVDIKEIKRPDRDAQLVAESIAQQLENRASFRRALKQAMQRTMKAGALGIKAAVSGRLGGADIARSEFYSEGTIPLQTLRADIDYGFAEADTTYGKLGIKVWIYKGEVLPEKKKEGSDR